MKRIIVASMNPAKIMAVEEGFEVMYPGELLDIAGVDVESEVSDQPMSDSETLLGAQNRAANARRANPDADFWIGLEGGLEGDSVGMEAFAWIVVLSAGQEGKARTTSFQLPARVTALIMEGYELGHADDIVFGKTDSKKSSGAVGLLTNGAISRSALYAQAVSLALIPHKNEGLYAPVTTT
jgi:inosine/xanthosine triphosphatase